MARYRHYRNPKEPGVPLFVTTTVLDFVHAFHRKDPRDAMVFAIARQGRLQGATLYGYVVMPHHIHLVVRPRATMNAPQFMRVFKRRSSDAIVSLLSEAEQKQFDQQRGLNGNTFWHYSFRSVKIESEAMFWQKMHYMHVNPVEAGYVEYPEDYRWSSVQLVLSGELSRETGLPYDAVVKSLGAWAVDEESDA